MATITVRNLDSEVQMRLKLLAARNNRSMEAEARAILSAAVRGASFGSAWLDATASFRGEGIPTPVRHRPRDLDLS